MTQESVVFSFGTVLLDLLSGKHIPPSHVCICIFIFVSFANLSFDLCSIAGIPFLYHPLFRFSCRLFIYCIKSFGISRALVAICN